MSACNLRLFAPAHKPKRTCENALASKRILPAAPRSAGLQACQRPPGSPKGLRYEFRSYSEER